MPVLSVCAARFAASMVYSFAHSRAFFDGLRDQVARRRAFHHAGRHAVDPGGCAVRSLRRRLLHAGQTSVDALDRGVCFVNVHLDDEFGLIALSGHVESNGWCAGEGVARRELRALRNLRDRKSSSYRSDITFARPSFERNGELFTAVSNVAFTRWP